MNTLIAREVVYFSRKDEDAFFAWLNSIGCVVEVKGVGRELQIAIRDGAVNDADLRELIALFHRYGLDKRQLAQFADETNASWFRNDAKYWYHDIFG